MLAVLFLVRRGDDILIEMPRSILDATLSRLKMFVLRARLTIEKADDIDALAIFGNDAPAMMSRYALQRSEERRVGEEGVSTGKYRWTPDHYKKKPHHRTCE